MNRREFLKRTSLLGTLFYMSGISCLQKQNVRPNIIFLLADDQRWDSLGCMGNDIIQTPHLDALAKKGVLFKNNFVTYSYCAPSRATILSGVYYNRHKIARERSWDEELFNQTYPVLLRKAGYQIGFIGKWHMGKTKDDAFDFSWMFAGQGKYFNQIHNDNRHLTRIMTGKAIEFLNQAPKNRPFCLSVSFKAPHVDQSSEKQFLYDPQFESLYEDVVIPSPKNDDYEQLPSFIKNCEARERWKSRFSTPELYQKMVKGYYRLITGIDQALGKITAQLEKQDLAQNTIIIFTSDNGFFLGEHGLAGKWLMYEPAIRTPLIFYDPRLPESSQNKKRNEMTLNVDIAPTILDLAGVKIPDHVQGKSMLPLVKGRNSNWRREWFYQHYAYGGDSEARTYIPQSEGVRTEHWKYVRYIKQDPVYEQLFDLQNDPDEVNNLAYNKEFNRILNNMKKRFEKLQKEIKG